MIKRFGEFISEEIINIKSHPTREGNNNWVYPMLLYIEVIGTPKKMWKVDSELTASLFESSETNIVFAHCKDLNYGHYDEKGDFVLPENYKEICEERFEKYKLGTPIVAFIYKKYEDGAKIKLTNSNYKLVKDLGLKGTAIKLYKSFVKETGLPLYSDDAQTPESRTKIWGNLISDPSCEIVGYDQVNKEELPLENKDGKLIVKGNQPIYSGDKEKSIRNDHKRPRSRILKLKSVK
jgi:hypothetical protein